MVPLAASTSAMVGMEGAAPGRDTARAEAREAFSRQRGMSSPLAREARKKPVKVSPAAVVSTAFTL